MPTLLMVLGPLFGQLLDKLLPDPEANARAKAEMTAALSGMDTQVTLAQLEVAKAEAGSPSLFVSGWRPAVGWVCVAGLAYAFLLAPMLGWFSAMVGAPAPPELDDGSLMALLTGMLGMAGVRTFEKTQARKGPRALIPPGA